MSSFSAYLALATARDKLRALPERDVKQFADVLRLLNEAISASKNPGSAESALELCTRAFSRLSEEVTERETTEDRGLPASVSEAVQIVRGALYHAAVELRSTLKKSGGQGKGLLAIRTRKALEVRTNLSMAP